MPEWWLYPVIGAFLLSLVLSDGARRWGRRFGFIDFPSKPRKLHRSGISLLGGVAIYLAFAGALLSVLFFHDHLTAGEVGVVQYSGLLLGGAVLMLGGMLDDKYELPPRYSILFPVAAALIAASFGIGVSKITNPLGGYFSISSTLSFAVTTVWLLGMMYTTKLLDGLDGLAGGVSVIGMGMISALALTTAFFQPDVALLAAIGVASVLGFLVWNWYPASLFLGEGGSTFVGYLLGVMAVIAGSKIATALLVVAVPLFDILFVIWERKKHGVSLVQGDRRHLHHRLTDRGWSVLSVVVFYYGIAAAFGLTTLLFESWQKLIALVVLFCLTLLLIRYTARESV